MNNSIKNDNESWDKYISSLLEGCQQNAEKSEVNTEKPGVNTELEVLKAVREATTPLLKEIIRLTKGPEAVKDEEDQEDQEAQEDETKEFLELMKGIGSTSDR